jgi:2-keto-4-pentenoate hydratase/2-oxohepta-3-ene-1,7-dioic acid hydratase in catechol pathway
VRLATLRVERGTVPAIVRGEEVLPLELAGEGIGSVRAIAAGGEAILRRLHASSLGRPAAAWRDLNGVELGPAVPDPGAVYTIGRNYRPPAGADPDPPMRPLVYGKAASAVAGHRDVLAWDRSVAPTVDAEVELGVVIGAVAHRVSVSDAMAHVFGYTVMNDVSSRDAWLDGDQWLLGKSMPGFCPVGPVIVTADELDPRDLALRCTIGGAAIQDGRTSSMRFGIAEIVSFLSQHVVLRPGDLIATGTPERLATPPGPERHLESGDVVTAWIEGIGELTTTIG